MSQHVTPFLVLNLGAEMLYVVSQRLHAQNISPERSAQVLDEITAALIAQDMIAEITRPQEGYNHDTIKQIIEDVAQSSIMRLDPVSMDRLWDLVVMVFKWQITLSQDVIGITFRHLYEIETFTTNPETQLQLHRVQNLVENYNKMLGVDDKNDLRNTLLMWCHNFKVRISLLLRLGFQNADATFRTADFEPKYRTMLDNLGENIYAATKQYNLNKTLPDVRKSDKHELNSMISQLLGDNNYNYKPNNVQMFKLMMTDSYEQPGSPEKTNIYSDINVITPNNKVMFDVDDGDDQVTDLHDELLNIMDDC